MNILFINMAHDAAGCSFRQAQAINRYTKHKARHFRATRTFYDYLDIGPENYNRDEFLDLIENADILHFCSAIHTYPSTHNFGFNWEQVVEGKKKVFHDYNSFPGHWRERANTKDHWNKRKDIGYDAIFSSIPQAKYIYKDCVYVPDLVDEKLPEFMPNEIRDFSKVNLCHFPTGGGNNKNTLELNYGMKKAGYSGAIIKSGISNTDVLRIKRGSNLSFDAIWRGFHGATTVENLALGIPTMCNVEPEFDEIFSEYFGVEIKDNPIGHVANVNDIASTIDHYMNHLDELRQKSVECRKFMENHWSAKNIANNMIKEWQKL